MCCSYRQNVYVSHVSSHLCVLGMKYLDSVTGKECTIIDYPESMNEVPTGHAMVHEYDEVTEDARVCEVIEPGSSILNAWSDMD